MERNYSVPLGAKLSLSGLAASGVVFGYLIGRAETSLLFGVCLASVGLAAFVRRDLRDRAAYWLLVAAWLGLLLVTELRFERLSLPALRLLLPIVAIALYVPILGTFFLLEKLKR